MRTVADVEASGYEAICVPIRNGQPGCDNHGHMPGHRIPTGPVAPATRGLTPQERADIDAADEDD